jgi:hypothetical protein
MLVAALAMPMFAEKSSIEERANADYSAWLPQAGDFSIGFSVYPFANFIGKMFQNAAPGDYTRGQYNIGGQGLGYNQNSAGILANPIVSIMGSYMLTDQLGVKFNIGAVIDHTRTIYNVEDDAAKYENPFSHDLVQDVKIAGQYGGSFSAGIEYRLGKKRVQGVFGVGAMYVFQNNKTTYKYGNQITSLNQVPTIAADLDAAGDNVYGINVEPGVYAATRLINNAVSPNNGEAFWHRVGLYTTVGVEWFVAPKIALGMNVNLDLLYKWSNNNCKQYEGYNLLTGQVDKFTDLRDVKNYNGVTFGTENIGANLYLAFYFGN